MIAPKSSKILFYTGTILLTALMLFSAGMYFFKHDMVAKMFESYGYAAQWVYPLAVLKILGLIAIWTRKVNFLTYAAYLGFGIDFMLAFAAHASKGESVAFPIAAIVFLLVSFMGLQLMKAGNNLTGKTAKI